MHGVVLRNNCWFYSKRKLCVFFIEHSLKLHSEDIWCMHNSWVKKLPFVDPLNAVYSPDHSGLRDPAFWLYSVNYDALCVSFGLAPWKFLDNLGSFLSACGGTISRKFNYGAKDSKENVQTWASLFQMHWFSGMHCL